MRWISMRNKVVYEALMREYLSRMCAQQLAVTVQDGGLGNEPYKLPGHFHYGQVPGTRFIELFDNTYNAVEVADDYGRDFHEV